MSDPARHLIPKGISFSDSNLADSWKKFKQRLSFYFDSLSTKDLNSKRKIGILLSILGEEGFEVYNTFDLPDSSSYDKILSEFDAYCQPKKNTVYERYTFFNITQGTSNMSNFILKLRTASETCGFHHEEKPLLIRDRLVCGVNDPALRKQLLRDSDLTLEKVIIQCRAWESAETESVGIEKPTSSQIMTTFATQNHPTVSPNVVSSETNDLKFQCGNCGYQHAANLCPARFQECKYCKRRGHYAKFCRKAAANKLKPAAEPTSKTVNAANHCVPNRDEASESSELATVRAADEIKVLHIFALDTNKKTGWYVKIRLYNTVFVFKIDTAAECNTLSVRDYEQMEPKPILYPTNVAIRAYLSSVLIFPLGVIRIPRPNSAENNYEEYYILDSKVKFDNLLSLETSEKFGFIKRNHSSTMVQKSEINFINEHSKFFVGLGEIPGKCSLVINPSVTPIIAPRRRFALTLLPSLRKTLDKMLDLNVITSVTEPTQWVSNIVLIQKSNGDLRVCIDPQDLNRALIVPKFPIPKPEEIFADFAGKTVFTVLDLSNGFWQIVLDNKSTDLTTFHTPFGRFKFRRLCFGISAAPEIFCERIHHIFGNISGCYPYVDDLLIAAVNEAEHDEIIRLVFHQASKFNVRFNPEKLQYKQSQVRFLGSIVTATGIQINPERIKAICEMPRPVNRKALRRFLGMVTYLASHIPNFSSCTVSLRQLTCQNRVFLWSEIHEAEFCNLKKALTTAPVLRYYNSALPLIIQTDASHSGLGSVLLQDTHPIAYASRALTETETRYSQIEKETLAIVFAVEKFHFLTYGRPVLVCSDHQPLESIFLKSLDHTSTRLQRLRLRLLKYNLSIKFVPGKEMYVADALSRAYLSDEKPDLSYQEYAVHASTTLVATSDQHARLVAATKADSDLSRLSAYVSGRWPTQLSKLSSVLRKFRTFTHNLSFSRGLLFFENRPIIPSTLKSEFLMRLHSGHLNVQKCKQLARSTVFWLGMSTDIENYIQECTMCAKFQRNQPRKPLKPWPIATRPWQRLSIDIATYQDSNYLVVYDNYSYWLEIILLPSKSASAVITALTALFSRFGIPSEIVSDNNPFNSQDYLEFAHKWGFQPTFSSPHFPQSNGFAEKGVSIAKTLLAKNSDIANALLAYRNAPIPHIGYSPAQLLMNRSLKTPLLVTEQSLRGEIPPVNVVLAKQQTQQNNMMIYSNQHAHNLPVLTPGENVRYKDDLSNNNWKNGKVLSSDPANRTYGIASDQGNVVRRNRRFLRPNKPPTRMNL